MPATRADLPLDKIIKNVSADRTFADDLAKGWLTSSLIPQHRETSAFVVSRPIQQTPAQAHLHDLTRRWMFGIGVVAGKQAIDIVRRPENVNAMLDGVLNAFCFRRIALAENLDRALFAATKQPDQSSFSHRLRALQSFVTADFRLSGQGNSNALNMINEDISTGRSQAVAIADAARSAALATGNTEIIKRWPEIAVNSSYLTRQIAAVSEYQFSPALLAAGNEIDEQFQINLAKVALVQHRDSFRLAWRDAKTVRSLSHDSYQPTPKTVGDFPTRPGINGCPGVFPVSVTDGDLPSNQSTLISPINELIVIATTVMAHPSYDRSFTNTYGETILGNCDPATAYKQLLEFFPRLDRCPQHTGRPIAMEL